MFFIVVNAKHTLILWDRIVLTLKILLVHNIIWEIWILLENLLVSFLRETIIMNIWKVPPLYSYRIPLLTVTVVSKLVVQQFENKGKVRSSFFATVICFDGDGGLLGVIKLTENYEEVCFMS